MDESATACLGLGEDSGEGLLVLGGLLEDVGVAVDAVCVGLPSEVGTRGPGGTEADFGGDAEVAEDLSVGVGLLELLGYSATSDDSTVGDVPALAGIASEVADVEDGMGVGGVDHADGAGGAELASYLVPLGDGPGVDVGAAWDEVADACGGGDLVTVLVEDGAAVEGDGRRALGGALGVALDGGLDVLVHHGEAAACGEAGCVVGGVGHEGGDVGVGEGVFVSQGWLRRGLGLVGGLGGLAGLEAEGVGCLDEGSGLGLEIFFGHGVGVC